jgi:PAS domain-containing protein
LSDALPVGIFQVDRDHRVFSSNGRLHQILGESSTPHRRGRCGDGGGRFAQRRDRQRRAPPRARAARLY